MHLDVKYRVEYVNHAGNKREVSSTMEPEHTADEEVWVKYVEYLSARDLHSTFVLTRVETVTKEIEVKRI